MDEPDPATAAETERARLEIEKLKAELRKIDLECRKLAIERFLYPVVVGSGLILAAAGLIRLFLT